VYTFLFAGLILPLGACFASRFEAAESKRTVGIVTNALAMECLQLVGLVLDLPEFFLRVYGVLKHMHLLPRTEMQCCVN